MFYYSVNIFCVNKSLLKFVTDFGPLLIFFTFYYTSDKNLKVAIPPFIVATLVALIIVWIIEKKNSHGSFAWWNFYYFIWRINNLF